MIPVLPISCARSIRLLARPRASAMEREEMKCVRQVWCLEELRNESGYRARYSIYDVAHQSTGYSDLLLWY